MVKVQNIALLSTAALLLAAVLMQSPARPGVAAPPGATGWEYEMLSWADLTTRGRTALKLDGPPNRTMFRKGLALVGAEGWELVTIQGSDPINSTYYFKRAK